MSPLSKGGGETAPSDVQESATRGEAPGPIESQFHFSTPVFRRESRWDEKSVKGIKRAAKTPSPTCDGPAVALLLHKFIDAFHDMPSLDDDPEADHRCCDTCRPKVLKAFKVLKDILKPYAEDLEDVENHRYANVDIDTSQISDISPLKRALVRKHTSVFTTDSSDED